MLETSIRIVEPGSALMVWVRRADVAGPHLAPGLLHKACGTLAYKHGLAACPSGGETACLLIATREPIPTIRMREEEWELTISDAGGQAKPLTLDDAEGQRCLPHLVERALLIQIVRKTSLWRLDSPRIWYEAEPFKVSDGIAAYRRYEFSALMIDGAGLGVSVDVATAFFTTDSLAYFYDPTATGEDRRQRIRRFAELTGRQEGQKGTLLYDYGRARSKCYFDKAPAGATCSTTESLRVKGQTYASLLDYYHARYPDLAVTAHTPAVTVSFSGLSLPAWVAADRLFVRVANEHLPPSLRHVDKIAPAERRSLVLGFWQQLGSAPFGRVASGLFDGLWRPTDNHVRRLALPNLTFGKAAELEAPAELTPQAYKSNYQRRLEYLDELGAYHTPPTLSRSLYVAFPSAMADRGAKRLAGDLIRELRTWTDIPFAPVLVPYDSLADAIRKLQTEDHTGTVVFVLNQEPAAYHEVAFGLNHWRVKRITDRSLSEHHQFLTRGAWDHRKRVYDAGRGRRRWHDYVQQNALAIMQLLDVVPYRVVQAGPFEAQLVIDVGRDRRSFALSLMIARPETLDPSFLIVSEVHRKPDHQHESINPVMLADQMLDLLGRAMPAGSEPLASMLILRDGHFAGEEFEGVTRAVEDLKAQGILARDARVDLANLSKATLRAVRVWERSGDRVENALEGLELRLNSDLVLVLTTGAATLTTGTAQPYALSKGAPGADLDDTSDATFAAAQLNFSSPRVAQRLPLLLRRTDEDLAARASQEIRRIR